MDTLFQEDLDKMLDDGCGIPGCECGMYMHSFFLHSKCHIKADLTVAYKEGMLLIGCAACGKPVAHVAVACKGAFLK